MRVLLDEGVPRQLVSRLGRHDVVTVIDAGWASVKNGKLLSLIAGEGFQAFVTCDQNMEYQQHELGLRPFAVLLLSTNHWPSMEPHVAVIVEALSDTKLGRVIKVECGRFIPLKLRR